MTHTQIRARALAREGIAPLAPLLVMQQLDYARFIHTPKAPATPTWRIRFSDELLLQSAAEVLIDCLCKKAML
jgi:hypothetical protein